MQEPSYYIFGGIFTFGVMMLAKIEHLLEKILEELRDEPRRQD